jgi:hypothetical protein
MLPLIHRSDIDQWWERNSDAFIWKEGELRIKSLENTREAIFYSERESDQYEIFCVKFLEKTIHWIKRLQEAPKFQGRTKKIYAWDTEMLVALQRLYFLVTRAVDSWVNATLEGYIIKFAAENHQYFSRAEAIFKKGARGKLLREIPLWIKAFLTEEGMLIMSPTEMAA